MPPSPDPRRSRDEDNTLTALLQATGRLIAAGADYPAFIDGMQRLPRADWRILLEGENAPATVEIPRLQALFARSLWRNAPHPAYHYGLPPLTKPGRNDACFCGSDRKYKQCCEPLEHGLPFEQLNLLPFVLQSLARKRWPELAGSRINPDAVADVAHEWLEAGEWEDAERLLAPWFQHDGSIPARHEYLLDLLLDTYTELGKPRKKQQLLTHALKHGDRTIRASVIQRQATIAADSGDFAVAWRLFERAMREAPDSLSLSHLEVTLLLSEGRGDEARERARFWLLRLRRHAGAPAELIELMQSVADQGAAGMLAMETERNPGFARLLTLWRSAPAPACHYRLQPHEGDAGPLRPDETLALALRRWQDTFDPLLDIGMEWEAADDWLQLLETTPVLWQSFDVLGDIGSIVSPLQNPGTTETVLFPLLDRAETLLRTVLRHQQAEGLTLAWGWLQNRPALTLLVERIERDREREPLSVDAMARLEWLVLTLNPNDNHGLRQPLLHAYLDAGRIADALALGARYPEDLPGMRYGQALALFAAGQRAQADEALQDAVRRYPKLRQYLLAAAPKPPRSEGIGVTLGGNEEAWLYREAALPLWRELGALDWLRGLRLRRR